MAAEARSDAGSAAGGQTSFIDRLTRGIASLPLGGWWVYPLLLIGIGAWATSVRWSTGAAPVGEIDLATFTFAFYLPYSLAMIHYLDESAEHALATFSPALGGSAEKLAFWRRELTSLPPRPTAAAALVGALFGAVLVAGTPPSIYLLFSSSMLVTTLLMGWLIVLSFTAVAIVLYHTWHQLKAVRGIHAAAVEIDPFRSAPLFAFSRLTALTGIAYLLSLVYSLTVNGEFTKAAGPAFLQYLISVGPALACFVVPLMGMHGRLATAKSDLLAESDARIRVVRTELYRRIDASELPGVRDISDALEGLTLVRDLIVRLPTWPWSPQLFGGFLTALFLPIVIWFITRLLGSVLHV